MHVIAAMPLGAHDVLHVEEAKSIQLCTAERIAYVY